MNRIYPESFYAYEKLTDRFLIIDPPEVQYATDCANCGGIGYMYYFAKKGGPYPNVPQLGTSHYLEGEGWISGKTIGEPCPVCSGDQKQEFLERISGLTGDDLAIRLQDFKELEGKEKALEIAGKILATTPFPNGLYTFWGDYGVGKTTLLKSIVNGFRIAGVAAAYRRMSDILSEVKDTYSNDAKKAASKIIHDYQNYQVVAIDEVDRIYKTEWSLDTTFTVMDNRYTRQRQSLTVLATNASPDELEVDFPYLTSRIREGIIIEIGGADVRPALGLQKEIGL
jgi:DNA replication protein DnaC